MTATLADTMPLLASHARSCADALNGVHVLWIGHGISDAVLTAQALAEAGGRLVSVVVPYGPPKPDVLAGYEKLGPVIAPPQPHPLQFPAVMRQAVTQAIRMVAERARQAGEPWMIVEDGGYAVPLLHDIPVLRRYLDGCIGAVEHTARGAWNYQYTEVDGPVPGTPRTLNLPAVTISGSDLKTHHEGAFVAEAVVDEILLTLRADHRFVRHLPVAVAGYGRIGAAVAAELAARGCRVAVIDPARPALPPGMELVDWPDLARHGTILLIGATGLASAPPELVPAFLAGPRQRIYLASASSKAVEFSRVIAALENPSQLQDLMGTAAVHSCCVPYPGGLRYQITSPGPTRERELILLASGYPVLFYRSGSHGAPNTAMDPVMTMLFLAAAGLPAAAKQLPHRLHTIADLAGLARLPKPWQILTCQESMLRVWCSLHGIDTATYLARIGFPGGERT